MTFEMLQEARRLRESGKSLRDIAKALGVSFTSVSSALKGKTKRLLEKKEPKDSSLEIPLPKVMTKGMNSIVIKYERCPGCGAKVQADVPCMVCFLRKKLADSYHCYMQELLDEVNPHAFPSRR